MTARERIEASKSARERGHPAGCACRGTGLVPASGFASGYAPCRALPVEASEIAALRAEVARLTEERDDSYHSALAASRALADRLARALERAHRASLNQDCSCAICVEARAAIAEWEEARRGSEGGRRSQ